MGATINLTWFTPFIMALKWRHVKTAAGFSCRSRWPAHLPHHRSLVLTQRWVVVENLGRDTRSEAAMLLRCSGSVPGTFHSLHDQVESSRRSTRHCETEPRRPRLLLLNASVLAGGSFVVSVAMASKIYSRVRRTQARLYPGREVRGCGRGRCRCWGHRSPRL